MVAKKGHVRTGHIVSILSCSAGSLGFITRSVGNPKDNVSTGSGVHFGGPGCPACWLQSDFISVYRETARQPYVPFRQEIMLALIRLMTMNSEGYAGCGGHLEIMSGALPVTGMWRMRKKQLDWGLSIWRASGAFPGIEEWEGEAGVGAVGRGSLLLVWSQLTACRGTWS